MLAAAAQQCGDASEAKETDGARLRHDRAVDDDGVDVHAELTGAATDRA